MSSYLSQYINENKKQTQLFTNIEAIKLMADRELLPRLSGGESPIQIRLTSEGHLPYQDALKAYMKLKPTKNASEKQIDKMKENFNRDFRKVFKHPRFPKLFLKNTHSGQQEPDHKLMKRILEDSDVLFKILKNWVGKFPDMEFRFAFKDDVLRALADAVTTRYGKFYEKYEKKAKKASQKPDPTSGTAAVGLTQGELTPDKQKKAKKMPHQMNDEELEKAIFEHQQKLKEQKGSPNNKAGYIAKNLRASFDFFLSFKYSDLTLGMEDFLGELEGPLISASRTLDDFSGLISGNMSVKEDEDPIDPPVIIRAYKRAKGGDNKFKKGFKKVITALSKVGINILDPDMQLPAPAGKTSQKQKQSQNTQTNQGKQNKKPTQKPKTSQKKTGARWARAGEITRRLFGSLGDGPTYEKNQLSTGAYGSKALMTDPGEAWGDDHTYEVDDQKKYFQGWLSYVQDDLKAYFPAGSNTFSKASKNVKQENLHRRLSELKINNKQLGSGDGLWGEETYKAVVAFQQDIKKLIDDGKINDLELPDGKELSDFKVDGILGPDTVRAAQYLDDSAMWKPGTKIKLGAEPKPAAAAAKTQAAATKTGAVKTKKDPMQMTGLEYAESLGIKDWYYSRVSNAVGRRLLQMVKEEVSLQKAYTPGATLRSAEPFGPSPYVFNYKKMSPDQKKIFDSFYNKQVKAFDKATLGELSKLVPKAKMEKEIKTSKENWKMIMQDYAPNMINKLVPYSDLREVVNDLRIAHHRARRSSENIEYKTGIKVNESKAYAYLENLINKELDKILR